LLGYTPIARAEEMIANRVSMTVWNVDQVKMISEIAERCGKKARLHLKVDTGMSRLGVQVEEAFDLAQRIARMPHIHFEGIFTHFARADEADPTSADAQEVLFVKMLEKLDAAEIRPPGCARFQFRGQLITPQCAFQSIALWHRHVWAGSFIRMPFA